MSALVKNDSCELTKVGDVYVLTMNAGENRFNPTFMSHLHEALDYVEKYVYVIKWSICWW
jgi:enoyl-CoA hydratase/carnithine racemase